MHNSFGETKYHKITNKSTVRDLKEIIMKSRYETSRIKGPLKDCDFAELQKLIMESVGKLDITDIFMFVTCGNNEYIGLDESNKVPICQLLPEDKTVYFIEDR